MLIILALFRFCIPYFVIFPQKDLAPFFFICPSNKTLLEVHYSSMLLFKCLICYYVLVVKAYLSIQ